METRQTTTSTVSTNYIFIIWFVLLIIQIEIKIKWRIMILLYIKMLTFKVPSRDWLHRYYHWCPLCPRTSDVRPAALTRQRWATSDEWRWTRQQKTQQWPSGKEVNDLVILVQTSDNQTFLACMSDCLNDLCCFAKVKFKVKSFHCLNLFFCYSWSFHSFLCHQILLF